MECFTRVDKRRSYICATNWFLIYFIHWKPKVFMMPKCVVAGDTASCRSFEWRHNGRDGVSNYQPHHCLFRRRSKKLSKPASLTFARGIHRWPVNSLHKWPVTRKIFPFDGVLMYYCGVFSTDNVSIIKNKIHIKSHDKAIMYFIAVKLPFVDLVSSNILYNLMA